MTIKVGDKLPDATFKVMKDGKPADVTVSDLTAGKKLALLVVPGAFSPACRWRRLSGDKQKAAEVRGKRVETMV